MRMTKTSRKETKILPRIAELLMKFYSPIF